MSAWMSKQLWQMKMVLSSNSGKVQMIEQLIVSNPHTKERMNQAFKALSFEDYFILKSEDNSEENLLLFKKKKKKIYGKHLCKCKIFLLFLADVFNFP